MFLANFMFSVNIVLPIFLVMFLGFCLRGKGVMTEQFVKNGNALVFRAILPVNLFNSVYNADVGQLLDARFVVFCLGATLASFAAACAAFFLFVKDKPAVGAMVHGGVRGNFALLGLPLVVSVVGAENAAKTALVLTFVVPVYNVLAAVILTVCGSGDKKVNLKQILLNVVKNPIIIGIVVGLVCSVARSVTGHTFPAIVMRTVKYVSDLATPFALLVLGGSLTVNTFGRKFKFALAASLYKTVLQPLVFLPAAWAFGFRAYDLLVIAIMLGVPTAVASYAMTVEMKGDGEVASMVVLCTTLLSVFSLTGIIYMFKAMGWI